MTDTFRALCAELVELSAPTDSITQLAERLQNLAELACRVRTALEAQPEPQGPKDEELWNLYQDLGRDFSPTEFARTVLARWGRPKPPSLKEQAMRVLVENGTNLDGRMELDSTDIETIRRALEALDD
jgi:hypothetical protein